MDSTMSDPSNTLRFRWWRWLLLVPVLAAILPTYEITRLSGSNFHEVVPGKVYRSSQPDQPQIESLVQSHGIRTVVNLRGAQETAPWYVEESTAVARFDVCHEDISLSAARLPQPQEVRRLVEIFDRAEFPILLHCFRGVDRTGLSSACARLLLTDDSIDDGVAQLGLRYGHVAMGRTRHLIYFFDYYREWLDHRGLKHSRANFRDWMLNGYCPGACRAEIERLEPREPRFVVPQGEIITLRVRSTNTSIRPWKMSRDPNGSVFLCWGVHNSETQMPLLAGRAGLFERVVQPGESVEITAVFPVLAPGKYIIRVDMEEAQHCKFYMAGSVPVEWVVEVRP